MNDSGIDELLKWGQANGAVVDPSIKFAKTEDRGVSAYSTKTVVEHSKVPQIKIPLDIIIRGDLADQFFGQDKFQDADNVNSGLKLLVAKFKFDNEGTLINDEDLKAKFAPFIDLLPIGRDTGSVFYWTTEEVNLLENTNLGGSLDIKLDTLIKEWHSTVTLLEKPPQEDLKFFTNYPNLTKDEFVAKTLDVRSWTSFGAYLWSSIIFTSRAFPHDLIDPNCKPGQAILLPIIDLLNHNNSANVEWKFDDGWFSLLNTDPVKEGSEVFNNYGAKGNEELLMGYGFAIDQNKCDSIALKVKLPATVVKSAVNLFGFKIPRIEDYTQFAFNNDIKPSSEATEEEIEDGMLFFINYNSLVPGNLLLLFMFLAKSSFETKPTLRSKLQALQTLRGALERKQALLKQPTQISDSVDQSIAQNAKIYRDGQKDLYKASLAEIKHIEKQLLKDYKGHLTTLKKIFKRDEKLIKIVEECFGFGSYDELVNDDLSDNVLFLWVILQGSSKEPTTFEYISQPYKELMIKASDEEDYSDFEALATFLAGNLQDNEIHSKITAKNLYIASEVLREHSYTRVSSDEVIIVEPLEL